MPELPDIVVYVERLNALFAGATLEKVHLRSAFVLRTFEPDIFAAEGRYGSIRRKARKPMRNDNQETSRPNDRLAVIPASMAKAEPSP